MKRYCFHGDDSRPYEDPAGGWVQFAEAKVQAESEYIRGFARGSEDLKREISRLRDELTAALLERDNYKRALENIFLGRAKDPWDCAVLALSGR